MKRFPVVVIFLFIFAFEVKGQNIDSDPRYAEEILRLFKGFCPSAGNWTSRSLAESRKIRQVLEQVRDDPQCRETTLAIVRHINSLAYSLERIDYAWPLESSLAGQNRQQMDILLMLETVEDEEIIRSLSRQYRSNQLQIALKEGELQYNEDYIRNRHLADTIVHSVTALLDQLNLNRRCLFSSPQILSSLSSILSSTGAVLSTGGTSLGFAVIPHFLGEILEFIRTTKIDKKIQQLGQGEFLAAYQCALESLSNQWCEAKEVHDLIELKRDSYKAFAKSDIFSKSIDIVNHDLPVFNHWLSTLRSPSETEDFAIAKVQGSFLQKESRLDYWKILSLGYIGQAREKLPQDLALEKDKEHQFNVLMKLIKTIYYRYTSLTAQGNERW